MNQDQVKELLLRIKDDVQEFSLIFSGKKSRKVHGLYHPETREIIIHNRNFDNDNALLHTAIHEFAHHVHFTTSAVPVGPRSHTFEFRSILHRLLARAEELGIYASPFDSDPEFTALTRRLRADFLTVNGRVMKEFGRALVEAEKLCRAKGAQFDDYIERVLAMDMRGANTLMRLHTYDITPEIGYQNMATVAGIRNEEKRATALEAFGAGRSADEVKAQLRGPSLEKEDPLDRLTKERARIERTIRSLQEKLDEVEGRIRRLSGQG